MTSCYETATSRQFDAILDNNINYVSNMGVFFKNTPPMNAKFGIGGMIL